MGLAVVAVIAYAASGQLDILLGITAAGSTGVAAVWAVVACLPAVAWIAIRQAWLPLEKLAPRRLRYTRRHPDVVRRREEGWRLRPGPFPCWGFPAGSVPSPPSTRYRRIIGTVLAVLGIGCFITTIVLYVQGVKELAGGFLLAAAGLFFLSSKFRPEV